MRMSSSLGSDAIDRDVVSVVPLATIALDAGLAAFARERGFAIAASAAVSSLGSTFERGVVVFFAISSSYASDAAATFDTTRAFTKQAGTSIIQSGAV